MSSGSEFDIISRYFKPLAKDEPGALGLSDDGAVLDVPKNKQLVITTDALVGSVHFLESLSPQDIAHKVVGVNLSDLAAMGAKPRGVFLAAQFPHNIQESWIADFAKGLSEALKPSGASLMGGDTVTTPGPMSFTLTAFGLVSHGKALTRGGASRGDLVYASGTIGDGALGLLTLNGTLSENIDLARRYARPQPRWVLGQALAEQRLITACIDISDGLVADLGHICEVSNVGAIIETNKIPLSTAAEAFVSENAALMETIISGGDDYELAFTVRPEQALKVESVADQLNQQVTCIGKITKSEYGIEVWDRFGKPMKITIAGYQHL